jgi:hypothetical protein
MRPLPAAAALLLSVTCLAVQAQAVYRCGDSYGQQPCAGGQQVPQAQPGPSAADRAQAGANARRDATLAATLEKDRLRQEGQAGTQPLYIPPPTPQATDEPHKWPEKNATRKLDVFTASAPGTAPKKKDKDKPAKDQAASKAATKAKPKDDGKAKVANAPASARGLQVAKPAKAGGNS